ATGDREQALTRRALGACARGLEPLVDAPQAVGRVGVRELGGLVVGLAGIAFALLGALPQDLAGVRLPPEPLLAADARLATGRAGELRTERALERADRQRKELEDAIGIARLVRELERERQHLHRRAPGAFADEPLACEPATRQRRLERRAIERADHDRRVS